MLWFRRLFRRRRPRRRRRRPWRLRTRLTLALLVVVAPIAALLITAHLESLQDQRRSQVQSYQAIGDTLRASIDGFTRDLESLAFAASIALSDYSAPSQLIAGAYLENVLRSHGDLRSIFVTDLAGVVIASDSPSVPEADLSDRGYVRTLQSGEETVWSGAVTGVEGDVTATVHGRTVRSPEGDPIAFLFLAFEPVRLASRLPDLSADSNVSLIDAEGRILYTTADSVPDPEAIVASPVFQAAQEGSRALIESDLSPTEEGERYGAFLRLPRTNWVVGFTQPAAAIDGPFESRLRRDIVIMVLLIAGGVGLMFAAAARLSKPLSSLSSTADAIARGEQPVVSLDAADADAMKLERAIHLMARAIKEREDRLLSQTLVHETLERVGETLATELDFEEAVASISVAARQLTQAQVAGIYMVDEGGTELRLVGLAGDRRFPLSTDDPMIRRTLQGEILDVPEVGVFPGAHQPPQLESGGSVHSFLGIPITSRFGDVHGGLFLLQDKQNGFTERHRLLATGLVRRASIVVENARLYSQARQQQDELREASIQKSEFIGMMSHELRTPITTIFGGARLLNSSRGAHLDAESYAEMIASIEEESERLYRLVEDLLMLAKTDLYESVDIDILTIGPVLDQAVKQFSNRHPGRPISVNLPKDTPLVMGEPAYLHQVLTNLISNADKYSDAGIPIEVEVQVRGENVVVKVLDRGPGVDPSELELIFESFFRSERTARRAPGKGLGLTVCRRLIEAMSGMIWLDNRKGGGLEACFSLPIAVLDVPEEEETPSPTVPHQIKSKSL